MSELVSNQILSYPLAHNSAEAASVTFAQVSNQLRHPLQLAVLVEWFTHPSTFPFTRSPSATTISFLSKLVSRDHSYGHILPRILALNEHHQKAFDVGVGVISDSVRV